MAKKNDPPAGTVCKHCQKPGFKGADGKMQHERRVNPAADFGGRRRDARPAAPAAKVEEREPERDHPLFKRVFGGDKKTESA